MQLKSALARVQIWHVLVLAAILRLAWALAVPVHPVSDPSVYDLLARRIAAGQGYSWPSGVPTAYWPVGTSALYGSLYAVFGVSGFVIALSNVVFGTALVAATYALARTQFGHAVSIASAVLAAIWPTWIAFTSIVSSEVPANLLFVAGLACALSQRGSEWTRVAVSTVLFVGAAYCRANMLPFIVVVPVLVAIRDRRRQPLFGVVVAALIAAVLIAPWALRNDRVFGTPVPISTNFGINLWIGNNPTADGGYTEPPPTGHEPLPTNEVAQDRVYQAAAKAYILEHPVRYAGLCVRRLLLSLDRETYGVGWNADGISVVVQKPLKVLMTGYWYLAFVAALAGLVAFLRRNPERLLSPFVLVPAAAMASPVLIMASERYHYPIAPFVAIFAAYALCGRLDQTPGPGGEASR